MNYLVIISVSIGILLLSVIFIIGLILILRKNNSRDEYLRLIPPPMSYQFKDIKVNRSNPFYDDISSSSQKIFKPLMEVQRRAKPRPRPIPKSLPKPEPKPQFIDKSTEESFSPDDFYSPEDVIDFTRYPNTGTRLLPDGTIISPDGKKITFPRDVYPERYYDESEVKVWVQGSSENYTATILSNGDFVLPDGKIISVTGRIKSSRTDIPFHNKALLHKDSSRELINGTIIYPNGKIDLSKFLSREEFRKKIRTETIKFCYYRFDKIYKGFFTEGSLYSLCDLYIDYLVSDDLSMLIPRENSGINKRIFIEQSSYTLNNDFLKFEIGLAEKDLSGGSMILTSLKFFKYRIQNLDGDWSFLVPLVIEKHPASTTSENHAIVLLIEKLGSAIIIYTIDSNTSKVNDILETFMEKIAAEIFPGSEYIPHYCGLQGQNFLCSYYAIKFIYNYLEEGADYNKILFAICPGYSKSRKQAFYPDKDFYDLNAGESYYRSEDQLKKYHLDMFEIDKIYELSK